MSESPTYCIYCGKANLSHAKFCQYCGQPIPISAAEAVPAAQVEEEKVTCPYCDNPMQVAADVTQLICAECAAAFSVDHSGGKVTLSILRF